MTSELLVDAIKGVTAAGSVTVTGEGNSTTTNLQQGLCKSWMAFNGVAATAYDSFNVSSITDVGTGDYLFSFTNNFNAAKAYTSGQSVTLSDSSYPGSYIAGSSLVLTSSIRIHPTRNTSGSMIDIDYTTLNCNGDLA